MLSLIQYENLTPEPIELPPRVRGEPVLRIVGVPGATHRSNWKRPWRGSMNALPPSC